MKQLKIVKIYDASNAREANHLKEHVVIIGNSVKMLYEIRPSTAILEDVKNYRYVGLAFKIEGHEIPFTYIAEFEEVEGDNSDKGILGRRVTREEFSEMYPNIEEVEGGE